MSLGHGGHGTGDLEVRIKQLADLEKVKGLIEKSYDAS
jgi:predicted transport protein